MQPGVPSHYGAVGGGHGGMGFWEFVIAGIVLYGGLFLLIKVFDLLGWILKKIGRLF